MSDDDGTVVEAKGDDDGSSTPDPEPRSIDGPPQGGQLVEAAMAMWQQGGAGINPDLVKHIRPEHIDKALDHADGAHKRLGEDRKDSRRFRFYAFLAGLLAVLILVGLLLFSGNAAILADHLDVVVGFAAGAAGGYGLGRRQS